jgi:benzoate membrane transport protein
VSALEDERHRVAAIVTFLVVVSGIVVGGISSAFWGLIAGAITMWWLSWKRESARGMNRDRSRR